MRDLLHLDSRRAPSPVFLPLQLRRIVSPLQWQVWDSWLSGHHVKGFRDYIVNRVREDYWIGFNYQHPCLPSTSNLRSAGRHTAVIDEYLGAECAAGRVLGPFKPHDFPQMQISPFGVVPKRRTRNWHLIVDLSSPHGDSVNEGIPEAWCSLSYISVHNAARTIQDFERGSLMAKVDIKSVYRNMPIHPDNHWLLGMEWRNAVFIHTVLP